MRSCLASWCIPSIMRHYVPSSQSHPFCLLPLRIVLATQSWLGGKNTYLAYSNAIFGAISLLIAILIAIGEQFEATQMLVGNQAVLNRLGVEVTKQRGFTIENAPALAKGQESKDNEEVARISNSSALSISSK